MRFFQKLLRRPRRWLQRTGWLFGQIRQDVGLGTATRPVWLRDNPFLRKASRTETRRFGLSLRLLVTLIVLSGLLLGGLWLNHTYGPALTRVLGFLFRASFPAALLIALSFVHMLLILNARTALSVSLAEEGRRGTLSDLLLTPLRRAEMLLAMGVGPARTAFLVALAGLPLYALLGQIGALTLWEIVCLYVLFALLCYQPPTYAFPALSGVTPTPGAPVGQSDTLQNRRSAGRRGSFNAGFFFVGVGVMIGGQSLGLLSGGWAAHLLAALQLPAASRISLLFAFAWPYYAAQILGERLGFFQTTVSPLLYVLPLVVLNWTASALASASALSAGDLVEMRRLALYTRAQTLARWTARAAGLCLLGVVWKAWVESGDTATVMGSFRMGAAWDAAGLLLLLGSASLPNVCRRALAVSSVVPRSPVLLLRRALRQALRPLGVAGLTFLIACALGGLSPFAPPVYLTVGRIALAGIATVVWAAGVGRLLTPKRTTLAAALAPFALLYGLPFMVLSLPLSAFWPLAALSPVSAWVRLFLGGPDLVARFPFWTLGTLPSFPICLGGSVLVGFLLLAKPSLVRRPAALDRPRLSGEGRRVQREETAPARHLARTAALMGWVTAHTDNPLLIYELRVRTRSGRWFDWISSAAVLFAGAIVLALALPDAVDGLSGISPFHFFSGGFGPSVSVWANLASVLLLGQCYTLCFRGQMIGEALIARDRQQGSWGLLMLSLLTVREIFWGKVWGKTAGFGAIWGLLSAGSLIVYGLAALTVGVGPALAAWGTGQLFVAAIFTLGVALGTALATFPVVLKSLRGVSTLLLAALIGLGMYGQFHWLPFGLSGDWSLLAERLLLGSGYALLLTVPLFVFAERRLSWLRRQDITAGDSPQ